MKNLFSSILLLLSVSLGLHAQNANSLLWKVQSPDGGADSYLFGTYHIINSGYLEEKERIKQAFENADHVVVETVIDSSRLMEFSMKMMMEKQTLPELLDSNVYKMVDEEFERVVGMNLALFNRMKPMAVNTTYIAALYMENLPQQARFEGTPMDFYFARKGQKNGASIVALETMMEQADILFSSQTVEQQAADLVDLMENKEEALEISQDLTEAYLEEKLPELFKITDEGSKNYGDMTVLLDERNEKWIPELKRVIDSGNAFIAVGALHLTGEMGVISLLEKEGYKISPVMP